MDKGNDIMANHNTRVAAELKEPFANMVMLAPATSVAKPYHLQISPPIAIGPDGSSLGVMGWIEFGSLNLTVDWIIEYSLNTVLRSEVYRTGPSGKSGCFVPYGGLQALRYIVRDAQTTRSYNPITGRFDPVPPVDVSIAAYFFEKPPSSGIGNRYSLEWFGHGLGTFPADMPEAPLQAELFIGFPPGYSRRAFISAVAECTVRVYTYDDILVGEFIGLSFDVELDTTSYLTIEGNASASAFGVSWRAE
jgi:hypothetical protein